MHLPLAMPLGQGTPLHCLLLPTGQTRDTQFAILDMRRILCPPTAPFITVEVAPISFQAIASGMQSIAPRHRPITAAYLNDELIGASQSVCGPVCTITLLSHRQTRSTAAQATVCLLDSLAEASDWDGFRAHFGASSSSSSRGHLRARHDGPTPPWAPQSPASTTFSTTMTPDSCSAGSSDPTCTTTSTTMTQPVSYGPPTQPGHSALAQDLAAHAHDSQSSAWNPWDHVGQLDWADEADAAYRNGENAAIMPGLGQLPHDDWTEDPWDPTNAWEVDEVSPQHIDEPHPWASSFQSASASSDSSQGLPPGHCYSPWSVWNEAEEQSSVSQHRRTEPALPDPRSTHATPFHLPIQCRRACHQLGCSTLPCLSAGLPTAPLQRTATFSMCWTQGLFQTASHCLTLLCRSASFPSQSRPVKLNSETWPACIADIWHHQCTFIA